MQRRRFTAAVSALAASLAVPFAAPAVAQGTFPSKPVTLVVPNAPGGAIELAKKQPGKLTYASPGSGSSMHLAAEMLKTMAGLDILHAPYKGSGPAFPDVFAGRVEIMFDPLFSSLPHIKAGRMKALAVISPQRSPIAPEVPAAVETLPGYVVQSVFGLVVPAATPKDVVARISKDVNAALGNAEVKARMADIGLVPLGTAPAEFDAFIRTEIDKWAVVVKASGATAD